MRANERELRAWMIGGLDGNASDHAALFRALVPLLRAFYRRRMGDNADEVEDLVQETLIAVHTRRATYDRERAFTAWLFAIARYRMIDHFRRTRRHVAIEELGDALLIEGFEDSSNAQIDVEALLETLPSKQARVIRAMRVDGHSVVETAAIAGISQSDVKISVHRGLKALARRIRNAQA